MKLYNKRLTFSTWEAPRLDFNRYWIEVNGRRYDIKVVFNDYTKKVEYYLPSDFPDEAVKPIFGREAENVLKVEQTKEKKKDNTGRDRQFVIDF